MAHQKEIYYFQTKVWLFLKCITIELNFKTNTVKFKRFLKYIQLFIQICETLGRIELSFHQIKLINYLNLFNL